MKKRKSAGQRTQQVAVIDIGAHSVRMEIAQIGKDGAWQVLEELSHPIPIGRDVFMHGEIDPLHIQQLGSILADFAKKHREYGISRYKAIATSAVREATNRDIFINRIQHLSGIKVEVLEASEEIRLIYLAVKHALAGHYSLARYNAVICTIGTGSTQISFVRNGLLQQAETFRLGTLRLLEELGGQSFSSRKVSDITESFVSSLIEGLAASSEATDRVPELFIAVGAAVRGLTELSHKQTARQLRTISRKSLEAVSRRLANTPAEKIAEDYQLSDTLAQSLMPCCNILEHFFEITAAEKLIVPMISTRDAILEDILSEDNGVSDDPFAPDIIAAASFLGEKYHYDQDHAANVAENAMCIFDNTIKLHGVDKRGRLLLNTAAILHDVGQFVNNRAHHKHSLYLIRNSQVPGISPRELQIIAAIARYHRRGLPKSSHPEYMELNSEDRALVAKLAAILRLADALDRSHQQSIKLTKVTVGDERIILHAGSTPQDLTIERIVLKAKANLFEDIFGLKANLR